MPKRKYKRKKTGLELLAAILVAIGAVLCIVIGFLSIVSLMTGSFSVSPYNLPIIFHDPYIMEIMAIVCGIIIIVIEGFNKLNDYWAIVGILILGFLAATVGALLVIIGSLVAIVRKVQEE
ncbi:MAG: hypothetical protein ACFFD2_12030 [Promethearchaeota archaeon]